MVTVQFRYVRRPICTRNTIIRNPQQFRGVETSGRTLRRQLSWYD